MIKVMTKSNEKKYILLGTGYGRYTARGGSIVFNLDGSERVVALCGKDGVILWALAEDVIVVEVDGIPLSEHF